MKDERETNFRKVERFLLDLTLLLMLLGGLFRIIAPEVRDVIRNLAGAGRPVAVEAHSSVTGEGGAGH